VEPFQLNEKGKNIYDVEPFKLNEKGKKETYL
jgi:hypothetical protein